MIAVPAVSGELVHSRPRRMLRLAATVMGAGSLLGFAPVAAPTALARPEVASQHAESVTWPVAWPRGSEAGRSLVALLHARGDLFGSSVAISGSTAVVGAPFARHDNGSAYVYADSPTGWHQQVVLTAPAHASTGFGSSVAVSGRTIVVGAINSLLTPGIGHAYIYVRSGSAWHLQATLTDPAPTPGDEFGGAVAISASTVVVSGLDGKAESGVADVFTRSRTRWHLQSRITNPGGAGSNGFGGSVAIAGDIIVVGRPSDNFDTHAAFVYTRSGTSRWHLQSKLLPPSYQGSFGSSVAIYNVKKQHPLVFVGDPDDVSSYGYVLVFVHSGGNWHRELKLAVYKLNSGFGSSLATSGSRLVIGAPNAMLNQCGTAYEFIKSSKSWREREKLVNPGCSTDDEFGHSIAISGRTALIGAPGKNHNAGQAYYQAALP